MQRREEHMINMAQRNLNSITNIIGNSMGKVLQSRYLEHFSNKMEGLMIFLEGISETDLGDFSLCKRVLECLLILLGKGDIVNKIIIEGRNIIKRNLNKGG
jgi:hypothetical protein